MAELFVVGRDQITRLHDFNNDGEADYYENFNNDAHVTMNGHEYVACLEADRAGNLYYVKGNCNSATPHDGSVLRVRADGSQMDVFATGFRNPNGMGMGPHDEITVAPQEGEWTPASGVFDVREGGFYGMMPSHHRAVPPTDFIRPICWFSRRDDNSSGGQVWTTSDRWGPLANQLLHMSYGQCRLRLVLRESRELSDERQVPEKRHDDSSGTQPSALVTRPFNGGSIELPLRFNSGIHRGRMNPQDGQLYLTGLRGWTTSAVHDGCFQRVRYVGRESKVERREPEIDDPPVRRELPVRRGSPDPAETPDRRSPLPVGGQQTAKEETFGRETVRGQETRAQHADPFPIAMKTYRNGVALTFTSELDRETAEDPSSYQLEAWNYKWSAEYGSPEYKPSAPGQVGRDEVQPKSATLLDDNRTVFIELPNLKPVDQLAISYTLLTRGGVIVEQTAVLTLNNIPDEVVPEARLHRQSIRLADGLTAESELAPGVLVEGEVPPRRMMAWLRHPPRGQLMPPPKPLVTIVHAYLKIPATRRYRMGYDGNGVAELSIGDNSYSLRPGIAQELELPLRKGLHRVSVRHVYIPDRRVNVPRAAVFRLLWESDRFPREAVPASAWFHRIERADSSSEAGRVLYATHHCANCHTGDTTSHNLSHLTPEERKKLDPNYTPPPNAVGFDAWMPERLRQPPSLVDVGSRLERAWLAASLRDASHVGDHVTMPKFVQLDDPQRVRDLLAYLVTLRITPDPGEAGSAVPLDSTDESLLKRGADLFEHLGCVACHRFTPPGQSDDWQRISLYFARVKYQSAGIAEFLHMPHRYRVGSPMPDFRLSHDEAAALSAFIRAQSRGELAEADRATADSVPMGNRVAGEKLFDDVGCRQCHATHPEPNIGRMELPSVFRLSRKPGCLEESPDDPRIPRYAFTATERASLSSYLTRTARGRGTRSVESWSVSSTRLMKALRCNACHARDEQRSLWPEIVAEEGSGRAVEAVPQLTWVGEKLQGPWIEKLLKGEFDRESDRRMGTLPVRGSTQAESSTEKPDGQGAHPTIQSTKPRPWLTARMPSFPAYASVIAHGMAAEHGVPFSEPLPEALDPEQIEIGRQFTLRDGGLDCRQCHGVGKEQPRGDASTQIALGINFALTRDRLRPEFALRQMLDPPRYDVGSRMPRFAPDLRTTAAKQVFDGDARKQFEALKQFIWSVKADE